MTKKPPSLSVTEFVRSECANLEPDRAAYKRTNCIMRPSESKCLVIDGKRCRYFEDVVLPIVNQATPKNEPKLYASRQLARNAYEEEHHLPITPIKIKHCECGEIIARAQRVCERCQRASKTAWDREQRKSDA